MSQFARADHTGPGRSVTSRGAGSGAELGRDRPIVAAGAAHRHFDVGGDLDLRPARAQGLVRCFQSRRREAGRLANQIHLSWRLSEAQVTEQ